MPDAVADLSVCGLVVGHLQRLWPALEELHRVTRVGGIVLCSDVHPIGHALGWRRDFKADRQHYAVRHTQHLYSHWHSACTALGFAIEAVAEPMLDLRIFRPVRVSTRRRCRCRLRWCCGCDASREQDVARGIGCL